ncbi:MAG: hypothetical protein WC284_09200 [Candidimonas sp.]
MALPVLSAMTNMSDQLNRHGLFGYACALAGRTDYSALIMYRKHHHCHIYSADLFGGTVRCHDWFSAFGPFLQACQAMDVHVGDYYGVWMFDIKDEIVVILTAKDGRLSLSSSSPLALHPEVEPNMVTASNFTFDPTGQFVQ